MLHEVKLTFEVWTLREVHSALGLIKDYLAKNMAVTVLTINWYGLDDTYQLILAADPSVFSLIYIPKFFCNFRYCIAMAT
jgi:hypothetical protein